MRLRRIIEHVRDQNWTAVGIDFCIVVIGVFFGIQVANWNEERLTRAKADVFTARLEADLRYEAWRYLFLLEYYRDVRDATEAAANALSGAAPLSNEALLVAAYRATQYKQGAERRATFDELISTGNIALIDDPDLLRLAVRAYSVVTLHNMVKEGVESPFRKLFRMSVANDVQRVLAKACGDRYILPGDYRDFDHIIDFPCETGLAPAQIDAAADALRGDPDSLRFLRLRVADIETRLGDLTGNNRDVLEAYVALSKQEAPP